MREIFLVAVEFGRKLIHLVAEPELKVLGVLGLDDDRRGVRAGDGAIERRDVRELHVLAVGTVYCEILDGFDADAGGRRDEALAAAVRTRVGVIEPQRVNVLGMSRNILHTGRDMDPATPEMNVVLGV